MFENNVHHVRIGRDLLFLPLQLNESEEKAGKGQESKHEVDSSDLSEKCYLKTGSTNNQNNAMVTSINSLAFGMNYHIIEMDILVRIINIPDLFWSSSGGVSYIYRLTDGLVVEQE